MKKKYVIQQTYCYKRKIINYFDIYDRYSQNICELKIFDSYLKAYIVMLLSKRGDNMIGFTRFKYKVLEENIVIMKHVLDQ